MNLFKKAFALFLLASLSAGQAQAVTVEITTDKVVGTIAQLLRKSADKVIQLLEKEDLSRIIAGLGLTSICYMIGSDLHKKAKPILNQSSSGTYDFTTLFLNTFAGLILTVAGLCGAKTLEIVYNA